MPAQLKKYVFFILSCIWLLNAGYVLLAQNASDTPIVKELSYEEKLRIWNSLSEEQKNSLRKRAREMPEQKFKELKQSFEKVKKFEPREQMRIQNNFGKLRQFNPEQKQKIKQRFKRFQEFPPERKRQFREKFRPDNFERPGNFPKNPMHREGPKGFNQNQHPPKDRFIPRHGHGKFSVEERKKRFEEIENFRNGMMNREKGANQPNPRWQNIKEFRNGIGPSPKQQKREPDRPMRFQNPQEKAGPDKSESGRIQPGNPQPKHPRVNPKPSRPDQKFQNRRKPDRPIQRQIKNRSENRPNLRPQSQLQRPAPRREK